MSVRLVLFCTQCTGVIQYEMYLFFYQKISKTRHQFVSAFHMVSIFSFN
uniref:Uncharacterized protein n=1 Tax=Anguilla anguilla TaxID=7936 RepID=A0A0E9TQX6_ANGAN